MHDLRHVGAVLAAQSGATTAELMYRLGHTTPQMALRYQHVGREPRRRDSRAAIETRREQMSDPDEYLRVSAQLERLRRLDYAERG